MTEQGAPKKPLKDHTHNRTNAGEVCTDSRPAKHAHDDPQWDNCDARHHYSNRPKDEPE